MWKTSRTIAVVAAIGLLITGAGCGSNDTKAGKKPTAVSTAPSGDNGDLKGKISGERSALRAFTCAPDKAGAWNATGTVMNDGTVTRRFLVTVSVTKAKTSEVLGSADKTYSITPGKSLKVDLKKVYADDKGAKGRLCVPRVVAGE